MTNGNRATRAGMDEQRWKLLILVSIPAVAALTWTLGSLLLDGWAAIGYRYELDYGEGIVWQQMRSIVAGDAYGSIDGFPAIVFHYPPLYHLVTWSIAGLGGFDELATGRFVSLVSTLAGSALAGLIAAGLLPAEVPRRLRLLGGAASSLMILSLLPVQLWASLMRVDMLALALALGGVCLAFQALDRPRLIHFAAAAFVAALYVKQSMIAAPAAVFLVLLLAKPRLARAGIASSLVLGLVPLVILTSITDGGFLRHIFLYNINRFDSGYWWLLPYHGSLHVVYFALAQIGLIVAAKQCLSHFENGFNRVALARDNMAIRSLIMVAYFIFATGTALMIGKSGAGPNYFTEWFTTTCILAGVGIAYAIHRLSSKSDPVFVFGAAALSLVVALQAALLPSSSYDKKIRAKDQAELHQLESLIRQADGPVISDDMVLLLRGGREVLWESAIFAELSETGRYDVRPLTAKLRQGEFAFIITVGRQGSNLFDNRWPRAVAEAIDAGYPIKQKLAGVVVHSRPDKAIMSGTPGEPGRN